MRPNLTFVFLLSLFYFALSCRVAPENEKPENENISLKNPVSIKINFLGIEQENEIPENTLVSENNSWGGVIL